MKKGLLFIFTGIVRYVPEAEVRDFKTNVRYRTLKIRQMANLKTLLLAPSPYHSPLYLGLH